MIPEFGHYAIILALCLALIQASVPLVGVARCQSDWMQLAKFTARGQCFLLAIAFIALGYCFVTNDFSVQYVALNSNRQLPLVYRLCAIWGAHEGSMLLWVFILSIWMTAVSFLHRQLPLSMLARVLAVLGVIAVGFDLFLLTTSDPFARLLAQIPANGRDLNPILQDPGLVTHPPLLYMGYVGFSVAFAFAMAALLSGRLDQAWANWTRPWTIAAWCFLTLGIILGSWWAYRELGWGGFWFWDPVENASLLPWLLGTALIHSLAVTAKRGILKKWTVLLALLAFALSLLGTFLVRSGVLISVHAFAVDPGRGLYLLEFLFAVIGGSFAIYAWRMRNLKQVTKIVLFSREMGVLTNNVILVSAMLTVLLGTLYPLILDVLRMGKISVGAPYFNMVFIPLMLPLLLAMGVGPLLKWQQGCPKELLRRFLIIFIFVLIAAAALPLLLHAVWQWQVWLGLSMSLWVLFNTLSLVSFKKSLQQWGMIVAHAGFAVTVLGLVVVSCYSVVRHVRLNVGDSAKIGPYQFTLAAINKLAGPNYVAWQGNIRVNQGGQELTVLHPQQRQFNATKDVVAKTAIQATIWRDLYVALGKPLADGGWGVRIYYKPMVRWVWYGGLLMALGGLLVLCSMLKGAVRVK